MGCQTGRMRCSTMLMAAALALLCARAVCVSPVRAHAAESGAARSFAATVVDDDLGALVVYVDGDALDGDTACAGAHVRVQAVPLPWYVAAGITVTDAGGTTVAYADGDVLTFTMPACDVTISAAYALDPQEITIAPCEHGSVEVRPWSQISDSCDVIAVPDEGYRAERIVVSTDAGEIHRSMHADTTFRKPDGHVTIAVDFAPDVQNVVVEGAAHADVSIDPAADVIATGTEVGVSASAHAGYHVRGLIARDASGAVAPLRETAADAWAFTMPATYVRLSFDVGPDGVDSSLPFADVDFDAYWYPAIERLYDLGLVGGYAGADLFGPAEALTRAQAVCMLHNLAVMQGNTFTLGGEVAADGSYVLGFIDVDGRAYYAAALAWAVSAEVVHGYGDGTFRPDAPMTRQELAVMLANYAMFFGIGDVDAPDGLLERYADGRAVATWAHASVAWAANVGIMGSGPALWPDEAAARGDAACMVSNFLIATV